MIALDSYLVAAIGLGDLCAIRASVKRDMVADLLETGNFRNRGDAVRQLHHDGYKVGDVLLLVDEAIFECKQEVVAGEMSDVNHLSPADGSPLNVHPGFTGSAS